MQRPNQGKWILIPLVLIALLVSPCVFAQETSAGIQGTVKDPTGGLVVKAKVEVASPALIGTKRAETDQGGYYRFANLPPGIYSLTVTFAGFRTFRQEGINLEVGHLPNIEVRLEVGAVTETVEVSSEAALIDSTQSKVQTNIANDRSDLPKAKKVAANKPAGFVDACYPAAAGPQVGVIEKPAHKVSRARSLWTYPDGSAA